MRVNIEAERGRLQFTKNQMCKALGVTSKTYNGYIRGNAIPSTVLEKLNEITGKSIDYLLGVHTDEKESG
jgi:DNA-binding helix-turn-helix protein